MRTITVLALLVLLAACGPAPNSAEACRVEKVTTVALRRQGQFWAVDARVNDRPATLMLDTGAGGGIALGPGAAARLGARPVQGSFTVTAGASGRIDVPAFAVDRLALGGETVPTAPLLAPELAFVARIGEGYDGILGLAALEAYDVEIDLPGEALSLYRRRVCPAGRPPWTGPVAGTSRAEAPLRAGRPVIPARLDGRATRALLDTGATVTVVDGTLAQSVGAPAAPPPGARVGAMELVAGANPVIWLHRFRRLDFAGIGIDRPWLWISGLGETAGVIIGQDLLRNTRLWISDGSDAVYIAPPAGARPGG